MKYITVLRVIQLIYIKNIITINTLTGDENNIIRVLIQLLWT